MSKQQPKRIIQLKIPSELRHVSLLGAAINKFCKLFPISEGEAFRIELCLSEAVNNVIRHSYKEEPEHHVYVDVESTVSEISFYIRDQGESNQQFKIPDFDYDPTDIANLPESGMGLFIMNEVMDEVHYQINGDENVLTLIKRFAIPMPKDAAIRPFTVNG